MTADWLERPVTEAATALLGAHLVSRTRTAGGSWTDVVLRLTEVEAYGGPEDPGSHARAGVTPRTQGMFGPPGRAYVYLSYGMHHCLNVVTGAAGSASAVLLRAGEVVAGMELARGRRSTSRTDADLARGPARLTRTLGVDLSQDGAELCDPLPGPRPAAESAGGPASLPLLFLLPRPGSAPQVCSGPRTGVAGAGASWQWRFWLPGEPSVSPYRAAVARTRRVGASRS